MDNKPEEGPVSRRDFLRRAGKDAVETGAKLVPGAAIAKTVLGSGDETKPPPWWQALADWRRRRQSSEAVGADKTPAEEPPPS